MSDAMRLPFAEAVRLYFLAFYAISVVIVLIKVGQYLPVILLPIAFLVPLVAIFRRRMEE